MIVCKYRSGRLISPIDFTKTVVQLKTKCNETALNTHLDLDGATIEELFEEISTTGFFPKLKIPGHTFKRSISLTASIGNHVDQFFQNPACLSINQLIARQQAEVREGMRQGMMQNRKVGYFRANQQGMAVRFPEQWEAQVKRTMLEILLCLLGEEVIEVKEAKICLYVESEHIKNSDDVQTSRESVLNRTFSLQKTKSEQLTIESYLSLQNTHTDNIYYQLQTADWSTHSTQLSACLLQILHPFMVSYDEERHPLLTVDELSEVLAIIMHPPGVQVDHSSERSIFQEITGAGNESVIDQLYKHVAIMIEKESMVVRKTWA